MARLNNGPRTNESPMEYEYDNGRGPVDDSSPFVRNVNGGSVTEVSNRHKRPSSELDSPPKPALPGLRKPEGQTYLFPTTKYNTVSAFPKNAAFTTPRKPLIEFDDTSGAEQSSPAYADSEASPDVPLKAESTRQESSSTMKFQGGKTDSKLSRSGSIGRSGKGEIPKRGGYNSYTDILHRKVEKRRRRITDKDVHNAPRRYSNDSNSEERPSSSEEVPQRAGKKKPQQGMGIVASILTFIDAHPSLPNTLSYYVQLFLNCFFALCMMYVLWGVFATIKNDINERALMESSEILAEMAVCAREFKENRCERETRMPALESVCNNWEKCMSRDPHKIGRSRLSAGMFAEIFNSFIEPISVKAIVVSMSVIVGCFAVNNLTFGIYRARHPPPPPSSSAVSSMPPAHSPPALLTSPSDPGHAAIGYGPPASQGYHMFQSPYHHYHYQDAYRHPNGNSFGLLEGARSRDIDRPGGPDKRGAVD